MSKFVSKVQRLPRSKIRTLRTYDVGRYLPIRERRKKGGRIVPDRIAHSLFVAIFGGGFPLDERDIGGMSVANKGAAANLFVVGIFL